MSKAWVVLAAAVTVSCASSGMPFSSAGPGWRTYNRSRTQGERFQAPLDKVWAATVDALGEQGAPVQVAEKWSGFIRTQTVEFPLGLTAVNPLGSIAHQPKDMGFLALWSAGRYSLTVHVTKDTDSTALVRVSANVEGFEGSAMGSWHSWESNGTLERRLFAAISRKL